MIGVRCITLWLGFCFQKMKIIIKNTVDNIFNEKEMIHFYKSILTLSCKYYEFILFKWVFVVFCSWITAQMFHLVKKKKKGKKNLSWRRKKTIHIFADYTFGTFLLFSLSLSVSFYFFFFLMDSVSIYLLKLKHFQTPLIFGSMSHSPETT